MMVTIGNWPSNQLIVIIFLMNDYNRLEKRKGKIIMKPSRIEQLQVPKIPNTDHKGNILRVIGIYKDQEGIWINTASKDNELVNMKLTKGLEAWGGDALHMVDTGINLFPCDIEFGELPDGRQYAEML